MRPSSDLPFFLQHLQTAADLCPHTPLLKPDASASEWSCALRGW